MEKDMIKLVAEYKQMIGDEDDVFTLGDAWQIFDLSKDKSGKPDMFVLLSTALDAGFMTGYKYAKRNR